MPRPKRFLGTAEQVLHRSAVRPLVRRYTGQAMTWNLFVGALLVTLVILGLPTLGLWLIPGGALALAAVRLGRPVQSAARRW